MPSPELQSLLSRRSILVLPLAAAGLAACTTTSPDAPAAKMDGGKVRTKAEIDQAVPHTLQRLYEVAPESRRMVSRAAGVLVFPDIVSGGLILSAQNGRGVLRVRGRTIDYYSLSGASVGFQGGIQSRAVIYVFKTRQALQQFRDSNGWSGGVDASVAAGRIGATGAADSQTTDHPVVSYVLTNGGLQAGVAMGSFKISHISF